jgi:hypothetical protein
MSVLYVIHKFCYLGCLFIDGVTASESICPKRPA